MTHLFVLPKIVFHQIPGYMCMADVDECPVTHTAYVLSSFECRFTPEEKAKRHPCAYIPFGSGPRSCIGMRLALLEVKMALIEIVSKFRIVLAPETKVR